MKQKKLKFKVALDSHSTQVETRKRNLNNYNRMIDSKFLEI